MRSNDRQLLLVAGASAVLILALNACAGLDEPTGTDAPALGQVESALGPASPVRGEAFFGRTCGAVPGGIPCAIDAHCGGASCSCLFNEFEISVGDELFKGNVCGEGYGDISDQFNLNGEASGLHQFSTSFSDCYVGEGGSREDCQRDETGQFQCVGTGDCFTGNGTTYNHTTCGPQGLFEGCFFFTGHGYVDVTGGTGRFEGATGRLTYHGQDNGALGVVGQIQVAE